MFFSLHALIRFLLTLLIGAQILLAATLSLRVTDNAGLPIAGANLNVVQQDKEYHGVSNSTGKYILKHLAEKSLLCRISHVSYETRTLVLDKPEDLGKLVLEQKVHVAPEVRVITGRAMAHEAVSRTNIDKQELKLRNQGQDLATLLEGTPGLLSTSYSGLNQGYNDIRLRGFDQKRIEVLLNGVPVNDPEDHYVYWVNLMDMGSSLEDIQIQRGTGTAVFGGNNMGGSISMATREQRESALRLSAGMGSHGTQRQSIQWSSGLVNKQWMVDGRFSQLRSDGFRKGSDSDNRGYAISGTRLLGEYGQLRLSHYSGRELTHVAWDGIPQSLLDSGQRTLNSYADYSNSVDDFRQPQTQLEGRFKFPGGKLLNVTLYHIRGDGFYETLKQDKNLEDYGYSPWWDYTSNGDSLWVEKTDLVNRRWIRKHQSGLSSSWTQPLAVAVLQAGLNGWIYRGEHFGEVLWGSQLPASAVPGTRYYTHLTHKFRISPWLKLSRWVNETLRSSLTLNMSHSRYELEQKADGNFSGAQLNSLVATHTLFGGTLGLNWTLTETLDGYGSLGLSSREPSRNEYWQAFEGPDDLGAIPAFNTVTQNSDGSQQWTDPQAKPESLADLELGLRYQSGKFKLDANLYHMLLHNEIVLFGAVDEESPVRGNAPRSHHSGLELSTSLQVIKQLALGGNLNVSRNRIDELVVYAQHFNADWSSTTVARNFAGNPIALSPELLVNIWLRWQPMDHLTIRPRLQIVGEQFLDNSGNDRFSALDPALIDPQFLVDGKLKYDKIIDGWQTIGLDASYELAIHQNLKLDFGLKVDNLLDVDFETGGYWNDWVGGTETSNWLYQPQGELYPAAGRSWIFNLSLQF